jgi:predicted  nucleic acid-binding Zn-ribbon protein
MQTIESLRRKIKSTQDLLSVVKTMKALAAVDRKSTRLNSSHCFQL